MRDAFPAFAEHMRESPARAAAPQARPSLRAIFDRLGAAGPRRAAGGDCEPLAEAFQREATPLDAADPHAEPSAATAEAIRAERRLRRLRAEAHAAYDTVMGPHDRALDAALAVVEARWRADALERDRYSEALKAIRLYGADATSRDCARRALDGRDPDDWRIDAAWPARFACGGADDA